MHESVWRHDFEIPLLQLHFSDSAFCRRSFRGTLVIREMFVKILDAFEAARLPPQYTRKHVNTFVWTYMQLQSNAVLRKNGMFQMKHEMFLKQHICRQKRFLAYKNMIIMKTIKLVKNNSHLLYVFEAAHLPPQSAREI